MKLQEQTGLSNADPIHRWLGMVDRFLGEYDWSDRTIPKESLTESIWLYLGHPVQYPIVEDYCLDNFQEYLQENGEPGLAEIVHKLRRRKGEDGIDNQGIRVIMMWLIANINHLKEIYLEEGNGRFHRKITAGWIPSIEEIE